MDDYHNIPELQKNNSTVKIYVNGEFLLSKNFRNTKKRNKWMNEKIKQLIGCCAFYFVISHREIIRKVPKYLYQRKRREDYKETCIV